MRAVIREVGLIQPELFWFHFMQIFSTMEANG